MLSPTVLKMYREATEIALEAGVARRELAVDSVAEAYLTLLAERGIEYLFANAGTDFAPLVEATRSAMRASP